MSSKSYLRIGVTQRFDIVEDRQEIRDALDQQWTDWLQKQGCLCIPIPNRCDVPLFIESLHLDGLLLSGGGDHPTRTACESACFRYAVEHRLPVLGVCHGMQAMAKYFGAYLVPIEGHVRVLHEVTILANAWQIPVGKLTVNSYHQQTIDRLPEEFLPLATDEQGHWEAMVHASLPLISMMWHPERPPFHAWFSAFLHAWYEKR